MHAADYNAHDVEKLSAFFEQQGASSMSNGRAINGPGYDALDPSTWTSCGWNAAGRLVSIAFDDLGFSVVGCLDLSGCTALASVTGTDCYLDAVDFTGCSSLASVNLTGNHLTEIDVSSCPELTLLWFKQNSVTEIDLSNNPNLTSLDCSYNGLTALDVTCCPALTILRCTNNSISDLDVSQCPHITELNCKTNLLRTLDISSLTELVKLYSFNNRLKRLDISVLNGGVSFVLEAVGNGYIGTKCFYEENGLNIYASSNPEEGESLIGWYEGEEFLTGDENCLCEFGEARLLSAHFTGFAGLMGDVDSSGTVTSADALLLLRYVMGIVGEAELDLSVADVDMSGTYTSADALMILRCVMGVIGSL